MDLGYTDVDAIAMLAKEICQKKLKPSPPKLMLIVKMLVKMMILTILMMMLILMMMQMPTPMSKEGGLANADHSHPRRGLARQGIDWAEGKSQTTSIDPPALAEASSPPPIHISSYRPASQAVSFHLKKFALASPLQHRTKTKTKTKTTFL